MGKAKRYVCLCCGYFTLKEEAGNTFQFCEVCYWEDDGVQSSDRDYESGANHVSLNQAVQNFKKFGASEECFKDNVRLPHKEELYSEN
ncbi:MAG TPA: CPCC family cysteine-rich protein [Cytophaga sp.]|jgi:hypothetical protein|nr:CPCC family cysteine-rich protein [Cytophaga sp.]